MEPPLATEESRTEAVAAEYRRQGYEVVREPSAHELPEFLSGFRPDLVASKGDEHVVVEVKSRPSLAADVQARELARLLQNRPGWRFELVVVEGERAKIPAGARPLTEEDIRQGLAEAARLDAAGSTEAALLLAWAIVEATIRLLLEREGVELERLTPLNVLKQAVSEGLISRQDHDLLRHAMEHRNAISHGFRPSIPAAGLVPELLTATSRLLG